MVLRMGGLFAVDGKLYQIMGRLADLVILNLLWILCSVPVITAGAATTAFYSVLLKMAKNEESYVFRSFFQAFRENFKQASAVSDILLAVCGTLACDFFFCRHLQNDSGNMLFVVFSVIGLFVYLTAGYLFPVMAFFKNSTGKVFRNSFLLAAAHFPYTLLIGVFNLLPWVVLFFGEFVFAAFFDVIIGFSLAGLANAYLFKKIFQRYIPVSGKELRNRGK